MNKLTVLDIPVVSWNNPNINAYAKMHGSVNNGVTTITAIDGIYTMGGLWDTDGTIFSSSYFPSYIKINDTKYNWIIDATDSNGYVSKAHVNISSPIIINNIFFTYYYGMKGNEEYYKQELKTFYDPGDSNRYTVASNYFGLSYTYYNGTVSFTSSNEEINGKNNFGIRYDYHSYTSGGNTCENGLLYVGETYRFTWSLGTRSYTKDVVADSKYSISSGDYVVPQEWCDQMTGDSIYYLSASISLLLDGKTTYEWGELSGRDYGDLDSSNTISVKADSTLLPTISSVTLADTNGVVPTDWNEYVQHLSNIAVSAIDCSGILGSTITYILLTIEDKPIYNSFGTLTSYPKTGVIKEYGTFDVNVIVTDSRRRTATKSMKLTFLPYSAPTITSISSQRCLKNGTIDNDGTFFEASGTPTYSDCNGKNSYHVYVSYKRTNETDYSTEEEVTLPATIGTEDSTTKLGNFDTEYSYDVRYRIADAINSVSYVDYLSTSVMLMHFMRGGRGVAFGQKATVEYCVDTSFNALFRGNVGFEINKKFYTIEQIITALNLTGNDSLEWVENNKKEF